MKKRIFYYGLAAGATLTLYVSLLDLSKVIYESDWGAWLGYLAILILPAAILLALNERRKLESPLMLKHSLTVALVIALLAATVYSAYTFIDVFFFDAQHLKNLFQYTEAEMRKAGENAAAINGKLSRMRAHYFSGKPYLSTYIWYLAMGLIWGLIFHFVFKLKKSKPIQP